MALIFLFLISEEIAQLEAFKETLKDETKKAELEDIITRLREKEERARQKDED